MAVFICSYKESVTEKPKKVKLAAKTKKDCMLFLNHKGIKDARILEGPDLHGFEYLVYAGNTRPKTNLKVMADFFDQLGFLLKSGLQLYQSLDSIGSTGEKNVRALCLTLLPYVEEGLSLDEAMIRSNLFDPNLVYQVKAGVESGDLTANLQQISRSLRKKKTSRNKISGMMVYPAFMLVMMIGIMGLLLGMIVPTIAATFADLDAELPQLTLFVIGFSHNLVKYSPFILAAIIGFIVFIIMYKKKNLDFKEQFDRMLLKIPIFGQLQIKSLLGSFCETVSTMMICGIPLVQAINISNNTMKNEHLKRIFETSKKTMEVNGIDFYSSLKGYSILPPIFLQLVSVGVQSGNLVDVLKNLSQRYEEETETLSKKLASLMEPAIILSLVVLGGICVVAMMLPIFSITEFM